MSTRQGTCYSYRPLATRNSSNKAALSNNLILQNLDIEIKENQLSDNTPRAFPAVFVLIDINI